MTAYVDSSVLLKAYLEENDSDLAEALLDSDPERVTSWVTCTEVRRNLARHLDGPDRTSAFFQFEADLATFVMVVADESVCRGAASPGEHFGVRSLDAIHVASALRPMHPSLTFMTFDLRQAQAARAMGLTVVGC